MGAVMKRVILSGGGTGGHIYPAITIARELSKLDDVEFLFVGTPNGMESRIIPKEGYKFASIPAYGLKRSFTLKNLSILMKTAGSLFKALLTGCFQCFIDISAIAAGRNPPKDIAFVSKSFDLPGKYPVVTVIISYCCQDGGIRGQCNRGKGHPFIMETTHKFSCYMLGIGSTSAIAADQDFMAFCQGPAADVRHIQNHGKKSSAFLQHFFMIVKN